MLVQQNLPYHSLGYWFRKMRVGEVFTLSRSDLSAYLEKYLPLILEGFPLPLAIAAPALNPNTGQIGIQIIHGDKFFEAMYQFYENNLSVCSENFQWLYEYNMCIPKYLSWNTASNKMREKIYCTGIHVAELLPLKDVFFDYAEIEKLSKIGFCF